MMTMMVLLLAVTIATAQRGQGKRGDNLAALKLTTEQQAQIKAIKEEGRAQMKAMRAENPEQRPSREAMKEMREASQAKVEAVLTTEQREQLANMKAERKAAWKAVDKEAMKAELKQHTETKVKPVISAARAQFDQFISAEDKAALDRLRPVFANKPKGKNKGKARMGRGKEGKPSEADRAAQKAVVETWKTNHAAEIAELKALTKKYAEDLKRIQDRMAPQRQQWGEEKRAITEKYLPEGAQKARGGKQGARKGKEPKQGKRARKGEGKRTEKGDWPKGAAFLLMKG